MLLLMLSSKLLNFITFILFLNLFTGSKLVREFNTKFSLSHMKLFTLVIIHIFILFLVLNAIVVLTRLLWSHLIVLLIIILKSTNRSFHHTALALWNSLPLDLRHLLLTLLLLNLILFHKTIFPFSFCLPKKTLNSSFSLFFSSLVSQPRLTLDGYLRN
jgi:hypothetical protein